MTACGTGLHLALARKAKSPRLARCAHLHSQPGTPVPPYNKYMTHRLQNEPRWSGSFYPSKQV